MRVLLISHTCQSRTEGQPKAQFLGRIPGVALHVVVPDRWNHYGQWRGADVPVDAPFELTAAKVRWPWVGRAGWHMHWYPELKRLMAAFQPDVIDLWEEPWSLVSVHACWLRNRICPSARIVSETEQNIDKALPFPFEKCRRYTLSNAEHAVARSDEAAQVLRAKGYTRPIEVVPNAVDAELFSPMDSARRAACRAELGLSGFVVGYVGRLVEEKGLLDLVEALPRCRPDVNVLLVGTGPLRDRLEQRAKELDVSARVIIAGGKPLEELPGVMNVLDALVLPSRTTPHWKEQFGRVIIEAQACSTPVIGSDSGAIPQVIGKGGLVFPEGDVAQLAARIDALASDAAAARAMGAIGREQVEKEYTWRRAAERMHAIYQRVLQLPACRRTGDADEPNRDACAGPVV